MTATCLLIEGVNPGDIPSEFLTDVMDIAENHGLTVEGISILRDSSYQEDRP